MKVLKANQTQFESLNGYKSGIHQLEFIDDAEGNKIVGESVLNNDAFAAIHDQLNALERIDYNPITEPEF